MNLILVRFILDINILESDTASTKSAVKRSKIVDQLNKLQDMAENGEVDLALSDYDIQDEAEREALKVRIYAK